MLFMIVIAVRVVDYRLVVVVVKLEIGEEERKKLLVKATDGT